MCTKTTLGIGELTGMRITEIILLYKHSKKVNYSPGHCIEGICLHREM